MRALRWCDTAQGIDFVAQEISDILHGVRAVNAPLVAPRVVGNAVAGLSSLATHVGRAMLPLLRTPKGFARDIGAKELASECQLTALQINDAIDELNEIDAVQITRTVGAGPFDFAFVKPTFRLAHLLVVDLEFDPMVDVVSVANAIVELQTAEGPNLQQRLELELWRIRIAVDFLNARELVRVISAIGGFWQVYATLATRRFVARVQ